MIWILRILRIYANKCTLYIMKESNGWSDGRFW